MRGKHSQCTSSLVSIEGLETRVLFAAGAAIGQGETVAVYTNPLEVKLADPSVLNTKRGDAQYYLSGTSPARFVSDDLVNWQRTGDWVDLSGSGYSNIWASEVTERKVPGLGTQFFYYFSAEKQGNDGRRVIGVARAASPDQPFTILGDVPLDAGVSWIDPHVLVAGKRSYLYVTSDLASNADGNSRIHVAELGRDMRTLASVPQVIVQQSEAWESTWIEGAAVIKQGKFYYLTYSSNCFCGERYSVGVATSRKPAGPFAKDTTSPILRQQVEADPANYGHTGPGHNGFVRTSKRELFMVYHTHVSGAFGGVRQVNLDRVTFEPATNRKEPPHMRVGAAGDLGAPTATPQPYPAGAAPTPTAVDDSFDSGALNRAAWRNIWGDEPRNWALEDGDLVIAARDGQVYQEQNEGENVFLQQAPAGDWAIATKVTFDAQQNFEHAFLTVWQDSNNHVMLKHVFAGIPRFEASYEDDQTYGSTLAPNVLGDAVFLQIRKSGDTYTQSFSPDGVTWTPVGDPVTLPLLDVKVGLGAWTPGSGRAGAEARFEFFDIE